MKGIEGIEEFLKPILDQAEGLKVTPARWENVTELHDAVLEQIEKSSFTTFIGNVEAGAAALIEVTVKSVGSIRVRNALYKCAEQALYKDLRVNPEFFEDPKHRKLYYPIMAFILKENLGPFFESLSILLQGLPEVSVGDQIAK